MNKYANQQINSSTIKQKLAPKPQINNYLAQDD